MIQNTKQQIAADAAHLIYEDGHDYYTAKQKARLGFIDNDIPNNAEIYAALLHYSQTIAPEENLRQLKIQRKIALEAMAFLTEFDALLTGQLLDSIASPHSCITLHLFASTHEEVMFFLDNKEIPYETNEAILKVGKGYLQYPCINFFVDNTKLELIIFPNERGHKVPPTSSITEKAMKRLSIKQFQKLITTLPSK